MTPKLIELLSIALDASYTHMYVQGTQRHIKAALDVGATMEDLWKCSSYAWFKAFNLQPRRGSSRRKSLGFQRRPRSHNSSDDSYLSGAISTASITDGLRDLAREMAPVVLFFFVAFGLIFLLFKLFVSQS